MTAATPRLPRTVVVFAVLSGIVLTILGLREIAWLATPAAFALVIVVLVHPVYAGLVRRGVPAVVAMAALLLSILGVLAGLIAIVVYAIARLATVLPGYFDEAAATTQELSGFLAELGLGPDQIRAIVDDLDLRTVATWLTAHIPSLVSATATLVLVYSLLMFVGIESAQIGRRSAALREDHPRLAGALTGFVANTRRYVAITGVFAVIVGLLDTVFLLVLGIPLALLWGLLAAACNFIPYVGFIIGLVPPALLALLTQGWRSMLLVVAVYTILNSIITTIVPAKVVGDAVGMSMTVTMASVAFWSWVLGPLGAVLAIPLSLLMKAVFIDNVPSARWLAGFVDSNRSRPG
ncbi:AI-2E family transporter [Actinoplanes sp. TRM 88003]|uniref:AI-2E family transporter n=1 Tax=Paractinoplanes aksuensis TaxID=2939490 RepID=A0ABT1E3S4_9ACTN|nr:AI-2E family transporter [Actinoplanes aksuensis]MCO8276775.1 AI-2E family transporter [Actinoplanes aksuensis]